MRKKLGLYIRAMLTLLFLWGLIYALVIGIYVAAVYASENYANAALLGALIPILITVGIIFLQFLISPWLLDLNFRWLYSMTWIKPEQLPPHLANFIAQQSQLHGISIKKVGMIHDQMPTALTYGRFKRNARLILSDGILNLLTEEEQIAVVGHELGHIAHLDFIFMTLASAVPLILYNFFVWGKTTARILIRATGSVRGGKGKDNAAAATFGIAAIVFAFAVISYIFYMISQYIVLFLSRVREYYADNFSGESTRNPKALGTALVKIAYGMVQSQTAYNITINDKNQDAKVRTKAYRRSAFVKASRALNIFDIKAASGLIMTAQAQYKEVNPELVARAAAFDLESPWATFLELQSTHPLTAKRLLALNEQAVELGTEQPFPGLGKDLVRESLWDEFLIDLFLLYIAPGLIFIFPGLAALTFLYAPQYGYFAVGGGFVLAGLIWLWRVKIRYPSLKRLEYPINIMDAVTDVSNNGYIEASPFRGKPIMLEGTIIGRGQPGYYFSEDVVLQDSTGIIILDYNPVFGFMRWIRALFTVQKLIGQRVKVIGWYRRSLGPYVVIKKLYRENGKAFGTNWDVVNKLFVFLLFAAAIVCVIAGIPI